MKKTKKQLFFYLLGILLSTIPVITCTLCYFPLWRSRGATYYLSGLLLFLLIIGILPFIRIIREKLKSPSAVFIWLAIFLMFFALSRIADDVTVIAFFGFIGNLLGAVFFKLSERGNADAAGEE